MNNIELDWGFSSKFEVGKPFKLIEIPRHNQNSFALETEVGMQDEAG